MKDGRYRGKRGMNGEQVMIAAAAAILAALAMTIWVCAEMTGTSAGEQLHYALFVAKDW